MPDLYVPPRAAPPRRQAPSPELESDSINSKDTEIDGKIESPRKVVDAQPEYSVVRRSKRGKRRAEPMMSMVTGSTAKPANHSLFSQLDVSDVEESEDEREEEPHAEAEEVQNQGSEPEVGPLESNEENKLADNTEDAEQPNEERKHEAYEEDEEEKVKPQEQEEKHEEEDDEKEEESMIVEEEKKVKDEKVEYEKVDDEEVEQEKADDEKVDDEQVEQEKMEQEKMEEEQIDEEMEDAHEESFEEDGDNEENLKNTEEVEDEKEEEDRWVDAAEEVEKNDHEEVEKIDNDVDYEDEVAEFCRERDTEPQAVEEEEENFGDRQAAEEEEESFDYNEKQNADVVLEDDQQSVQSFASDREQKEHTKSSAELAKERQRKKNKRRREKKKQELDKMNDLLLVDQNGGSVNGVGMREGSDAEISSKNDKEEKKREPSPTGLPRISHCRLCRSAIHNIGLAPTLQVCKRHVRALQSEERKLLKVLNSDGGFHEQASQQGEYEQSLDDLVLRFRSHPALNELNQCVPSIMCEAKLESMDSVQNNIFLQLCIQLLEIRRQSSLAKNDPLLRGSLWSLVGLSKCLSFMPHMCLAYAMVAFPAPASDETTAFRDFTRLLIKVWSPRVFPGEDVVEGMEAAVCNANLMLYDTIKIGCKPSVLHVVMKFMSYYRKVWTLNSIGKIPVPATIHMNVPSKFRTGCAGKYTLDGGRRNEQPVWKHVDGHRWLFWDSGWYVSEASEVGPDGIFIDYIMCKPRCPLDSYFLPHEVVGTWMRWEQSEDNWVKNECISCQAYDMEIRLMELKEPLLRFGKVYVDGRFAQWSIPKEDLDDFNASPKSVSEIFQIGPVDGIYFIFKPPCSPLRHLGKQNDCCALYVYCPQAGKHTFKITIGTTSRVLVHEFTGAEDRGYSDFCDMSQVPCENGMEIWLEFVKINDIPFAVHLKELRCQERAAAMMEAHHRQMSCDHLHSQPSVRAMAMCDVHQAQQPKTADVPAPFGLNVPTTIDTKEDPGQGSAGEE